MAKIHLIIVAGGSGTRTGADIPKQYIKIAGKSVLEHTIGNFFPLIEKNTEAISALNDDKIATLVSLPRNDEESCSHCEEQSNEAISPINEKSLPIQAEEIVSISVVISKDHLDFYNESLSEQCKNNIRTPVYGGSTRQESVYKGLLSLRDIANDQDIVLIHDAARPFTDYRNIAELLDYMQKAIIDKSRPQSATLAIQVSDTCKVVDDNNRIVSDQIVNRDVLRLIQTPQAFYFGDLLKAHEFYMSQEDANSIKVTDDTSLINLIGIKTAIINGNSDNFKITTASDIEKAKMMINKNKQRPKIKTGSGFDVHAFDKEQYNDEVKIKLGGVDVKSKYKLIGHSDADVVLHALCDAILGSCGEGDIGLHFPPSDNKWKNTDSSIFVKHALSLLNVKLGKIVNIDITVICEFPKITAYRDAIKAKISELTGVDPSDINVKATTTEGLGFTGRGEGIACIANINAEFYTNDTELLTEHE